jgi:hypothetical protein
MIEINNNKFYTGGSNIFAGINSQYSLHEYNNSHNDVLDFVDYNYNCFGINKLSPYFYLEQYEFKPLHNKIERH